MTTVDMPKVIELLDKGWVVRLFRNGLGSYTAKANHYKEKPVFTDDFSPDRALTRLAFKVDGKII
jgi:hypothetical protein